MALGLGLLRLGPAEFWTMTPRELERALAGMFGADRTRPLDRGGLDALMQRYPDRPRPAAPARRNDEPI